MMNNVYFLHQMKHNKTENKWDKGIVVKDSADESNWDAVRQGFHAYLGAYGYGNNEDTDYVQCEVTDVNGARLLFETWRAQEKEQESDA